MSYIVCIILGIVIGGLGIYFVLKPKITATQELDQETLTQNQKIHEENKYLTQINIKFSNDKIALETKVDELKNSISNLEEASRTAAEKLYNSSMETMQEALSNAAEKLGKDYQEQEELFKQEYLTLMEDLTNELKTELLQKQETLEDIKNQINDISSIFAAAVEANKRTQEMLEQEDFYRLQLSEEDLEEVYKLKDISKFLRNKEPLNKVIWKVYYEKPYTDLIGRVIGKGQKTGIYKITNIKNKMCYVGQAVDVSNRWKQHIKRGLGAETPTKNKLYPVMAKEGVENFTFELIEECSPAQLNDREKYWQEFFKAKEFGYSIK